MQTFTTFYFAGTKIRMEKSAVRNDEINSVLASPVCANGEKKSPLYTADKT